MCARAGCRGLPPSCPEPRHCSPRQPPKVRSSRPTTKSALDPKRCENGRLRLRGQIRLLRMCEYCCRCWGYCCCCWSIAVAVGNIAAVAGNIAAAAALVNRRRPRGPACRLGPVARQRGFHFRPREPAFAVYWPRMTNGGSADPGAGLVAGCQFRSLDGGGSGDGDGDGDGATARGCGCCRTAAIA